MDWTEKYRPNSLNEVRGNNSARDELRDWADSWESHKEAVILHGSPGVGKTSAAHALAKDYNWNIIELNASDDRTADVINRVAGEAAKSGTLTAGESGQKLIIIDEADNLHGNVDRGGTQAITNLVKDADQPVVLIANEFYEMSQGLRNAARSIEFRDISKRSIIPVLRDICRRESVEFDEEALDILAEKNAGDLRGAINDLQAVVETEGEITKEDVMTGSRDRTTGIFEFLDIVFKEGSAQESLQTSYSVDETPDDLINWIEDNLPKEYSGEELASAYEFLTEADQWLGRVQASQNYSYWRYASDLMVAGVAASRTGNHGGWTRWGPPSYWSKLGRTSGTRSTRDYIAREIAEISGVSMSTARRDIMPFLSVMTHHCTNRELTVAMTAAYSLDASHVSFITGSGKNTNKVTEIVEEAEQPLAEDPTGESGGSRGNSDAVTGAVDSKEESSEPDEPEEGTDQQANFTDFV